MAAFDTPEVKFYTLPNGTARALLGVPFDRRGGSYLLRARVRVIKAGKKVSKSSPPRCVRARRNFPTQNISMKSSTAGTMSRTDALRREKSCWCKTA
jgi:hypothetical protein